MFCVYFFTPWCVLHVLFIPPFADLFELLEITEGHSVAQLVEVAGSIPDSVIWIFHWHNPSGRTTALGVDSASNRNEYQEYFRGGGIKAAGA